MRIFSGMSSGLASILVRIGGSQSLRKHESQVDYLVLASEDKRHHVRPLGWVKSESSHVQHILRLSKGFSWVGSSRILFPSRIWTGAASMMMMVAVLGKRERGGLKRARNVVRRRPLLASAISRKFR